MTRVGRRPLAVVLVTGAAIAAASAAGTRATPNPAMSNGVGKLGAPMRIVSSIRNTSAQTISIVLAKVTAPGCDSVTAAPLVGSFPMLVEAGAQAEVVFATPGFAAGDLAGGQPTCPFDIVETPSAGPATRLVAKFAVATTGTPLDPQATALDFVPPFAGGEIQRVLVQNFGATPLTKVTGKIAEGSGTRVQFAGGSAACGGHTCVLPSPILVGSAFEVPVECVDAGAGATVTLATIAWGSAGSSATTTQSVTCNPSSAGTTGEAIRLDTTTLAIVAAPNALGSATAHVTSSPDGSDALVSATLSTADAAAFSFVGLAGCVTPQHCDLSATPVALPSQLVVACTPTSSPRDTILVVRGASGTQASALVTCIGDATGGPVLQLSTSSVVVPGVVPVGTPSAPVPLTLTNAGSGTLTATIAVPPPAEAEWELDACTPAAPCSLVGHGSATTVGVTLKPTAHGDRGATMTVTTNDPGHATESVSLAGTGYGGVLEVVDPASQTLAFGTIPNTQAADITVAMRDDGNAPLSVGIAPPALPFSAARGTVDVAANGGTNTFLARCGGPGASPFAGGGDFLLTSAAYTAPTITLHATCTIVDAPVTITPARFDFGEVRVGQDPAPRPFTITNVATSDVTIDALAIANAPAILAIAGAPTMPVVLHPNATLTGTVVLTPSADAVVADDVALAFTVDGTGLALPITGRVVTPHAKVSPIELDLGTACVGSPAAGTIRLINDGTATLAMTSPTMDRAYLVHDLSPTTYPASLLANTSASVEVVPASTAAGTVHGILSWPVDVPSGAFLVPVDLDYIDAGTAVSPRSHDFDAIPIKTASDRRAVTIENCNPDPIVVTVRGITAIDGAAEAWDLQPASEQRTLLPHASTKLLVRFVPTESGTYRANIAIATGDAESDVELRGVATGPRPRTSFYACGCAAPGVPATGWPIVLAIGLAARRRRGLTRT